MLPPAIVCGLCHRGSEGHDRLGNCLNFKRDRFEPNYVTQAREVRRLMAQSERTRR